MNAAPASTALNAAPWDLDAGTDFAVKFLHYLGSDHTHNLVSIDAQGIIHGRTFQFPAQQGEARAWVAERNGRVNLYYTLNEPKPDAPNCKLRKEHIARLRGVAVDLDPRDGFALDAERKRLLGEGDLMMKESTPPTLTLDSGGGIQALWLFDEPLPATPENIRAVEAQGRALANKYGGDHVQSVEHIFRLPGTVNIPNAQKVKKGRTPALAGLIGSSGKVYALSDLAALAAPRDAPPRTGEAPADVDLDWPTCVGVGSWDDLPAELRARFEAARANDPRLAAVWAGDVTAVKDTSRSGFDFALCGALKRHGFTPTEIGQVMMVFPHGRGADHELTERDVRRAYVNNTTTSAAQDFAPHDPDTEAELVRLAALSPIAYDNERAAVAAKLGVRVGTLDQEVASRRPQRKNESASGTGLEYPAIEPWPEAVDGAALLDGLTAVFRRHVVMSESQEIACALWALHAHAHGLRDVSPLLAITSPEKRCGKTTLLHLLYALVPKPQPASNITAAALFRVVELAGPTLLVDEADTFLQANDELRGILNSGHTRSSAHVVRCVGDDSEPRAFKTWAPKAVALIGKLPDTLEDRAIEIRLQRRLPVEPVTKLRKGALAAVRELARQAARFVADHETDIQAAEPSPSPGLNDRAVDNWEPLLAIADLAGPVWAQRARDAATTLAAAVDEESVLVLLLADLRAIFEQRGGSHIATADLLGALHTLDERPWGDYKFGHAITSRQVAHILRGVNIRPVTFRKGKETPKGYALANCTPSFLRYLGNLSATPQQMKENNELRDNLSATPGPNVADKNGFNSLI